MSIDLNILIPSVNSRQHKLDRLLDTLNKQKNSNVLVSVFNTDGINMTIGTKRNAMLAQSKGRYSSFIDDDDLVSDDYIQNILTSIDSKQPDVIGFKVAYYNNGKQTGMIDQSTKYRQFNKEIYRQPDNSAFFNITKPVNHLNPVKTDIAQRVGFPDLRYGEDKVYSAMLQNYIKSSDYIDKYMYHYLWTNNDNSLNTLKNTYITSKVDDK